MHDDSRKTFELFVLSLRITDSRASMVVSAAGLIVHAG